MPPIAAHFALSKREYVEIIRELRALTMDTQVSDYFETGLFKSIVGVLTRVDQ